MGAAQRTVPGGHRAALGLGLLSCPRGPALARGLREAPPSLPPAPPAGRQGSFCMLCLMQNHIVQAFANSGNAIKPVSFIRDLKSKSEFLVACCYTCAVRRALGAGAGGDEVGSSPRSPKTW